MFDGQEVVWQEFWKRYLPALHRVQVIVGFVISEEGTHDEQSVIEQETQVLLVLSL